MELKKLGLKEELENFTYEFLSLYLVKDTKRAYQSDLLQFFKFAEEFPEWCKQPTLVAYRDLLLSKNLAPATIHRKMVSIRKFCDWLLSQGHIQYNPFLGVKLPRIQTQSPTIAVSDEKANLLIEAPDTSQFKGLSHRFIILCLFYLGLRRNELCQLKWSDLREERGILYLSILGKGDKIRKIPLTDQFLEELYEYRYSTEMHYQESTEEVDYLIQVGKKKSLKPVDGSTVYRIIKRYSKKIGLLEALSPHSCRATAISHLLDTQKVGIREAALFAGHSQITTTQRYDKKRKELQDNPSTLINYSSSKTSDEL